MEYDITRHKHYDDFTIMPNSILREQGISFAAKGLLGYLLSLPDDWNINVQYISKNFHLSERAVLLLLRELIKYGYCQRSPKRVDGRMCGQRYQITDVPFDFSAPAKNGGTEAIPAPTNFRGTEIPAPQKNEGAYKEQTNNKEQNTNKEHSIGGDEESSPTAKPKRKIFVKPSPNEVRDFVKEKNLLTDPDLFYTHYEATEWTMGKNKMRNWQAAVWQWHYRELKKQQNDNPKQNNNGISNRPDYEQRRENAQGIIERLIREGFANR